MANNQTLAEKIKNMVAVGKVPSELANVTLSGGANRTTAERLLYAAYTGRLPTEASTLALLNNQTIADAIYTTFGRDPTGLSNLSSPLQQAMAAADVFINPTIGSTVTGVATVTRVQFPNNPNNWIQNNEFQRFSNVSNDRPQLTGSAGTSNARLVFDGSNDILDLAQGYNHETVFNPVDPFYAEANKGPTTCGLAKASDGTWWIGHFGKKNESTAGSETFDGSLIHYNADFSVIIQEIRFQSLGLTGVGIQGVAIDTQDGMIWCADPGNNAIYKINPVGPAVDKNFSSKTGANGIAYDDINNQILWSAANSATITRANKTTGASISTFTIRDITNNTLDMLYFQNNGSAAGMLWTTCRDNGVPGRIIKYDLNRQATPVGSWSITECKAVEGLVVDGNNYYLCSDEYYHNQAADRNRVIKGTFAPTRADYGTKLVIAGLFKIAATPGSTVALLQGGDAVTTGGPIRVGVGFYYTSVAGTFRCITTIGSNQVVFDFTSQPTTTDSIYYLTLDTVANSCTLFLNGTIVGSAQTNANLTGILPAFMWSLGGDYENAAVATRFGNVTIGGLWVTTDVAHQAEIEGYLAWQTGNQSLLPGGHTYKNAAPT